MTTQTNSIENPLYVQCFHVTSHVWQLLDQIPLHSLQNLLSAAVATGTTVSPFL